MLLELEAMKKEEEIDEQLAAKKRQAEIRKKHEEVDKLTEELEIAKLQEEMARALRISEKEIEIARAGSSRSNTILRSVSPVPIQSDSFEKVPSWLVQIEVDDKLLKNGIDVCRIALANEPMQQQPGAMPQTTKLFQPAAKMAQPTVANVGNSGSSYNAEERAIQFGNGLHPNEPTTNSNMINDTVPPHVAPSVNLAHPT